MELAKLDEIRETLPEAIGSLSRIVVDNPKQITLLACSSFVVARVIGNLVRPRTPAQILATAVTASAVCSYLAAEAMNRGILDIRIRDEDGKLVSFRDLETADYTDIPLGKVRVHDVPECRGHIEGSADALAKDCCHAPGEV